MAIEAICRLSDASQRDVAATLGITSELTAGQHRRRLAERLAEVVGLRRELERLIGATR